MDRTGSAGATAWMFRAMIAAVAAFPLSACVVYEPVPAYQAPSTIDRSWAAALGAMQDQGVAISEQDRASGVIRGARGSIAVSAVVRTQPDGRVRVEFTTPGGAQADPGLVDRISASYNKRMGR